MISIEVRDELEARVLQTAAEILWEGGLDALTIEEVTKRSGVAKTTIYRRYDSATELGIRAMKALVLAELAIPDTGSLATDLAAHYRAFLQMSEGDGFQRVVLSLMGATVSNSDLHDVLVEMDAQRARVIVAMVDAARARGEVTRDLNDDQLMAFIDGPMFMLRVHQSVEVSDDDVTEIANAVVAALR